MGIAEISVKARGKIKRIFTAKNFVTTEGMEALLKSTFSGVQPRPMYHDVVNDVYMGGLYVGAIIQTDGNIGGPININDTWDTKAWKDWPYAGGKIYAWKNIHGGCVGYWDGSPPQYIAEIGLLPYGTDSYLNVGAVNFNGYPDPKVVGTKYNICQGLYTGVFFDNTIYPQENTFQLFSIIPFQVPLFVSDPHLELGIQYNINIAELLT